MRVKKWWIWNKKYVTRETVTFKKMQAVVGLVDKKLISFMEFLTKFLLRNNITFIIIFKKIKGLGPYKGDIN